MQIAVIAEFYNNICALLPLLMLTKVMDRHRRHNMKELPPEGERHLFRRRNTLRRHQAVLVLAFIGEGLALMSAAWAHGQDWLDVTVIALVAVCGILATIDLLDGRLSA